MSSPSLTGWFRAILTLSLAACLGSCGSSSGAPAGTTTTDYVGTLEGTNVLVGLVVTNGQALLFFCGEGKTLTTLTHWMHGAVTLGQPFDLTDGTASATGAPTGASTTHLSGTFRESASAKPMTWSADLVTVGTLAGVYTHQLTQGLVALIVRQPAATSTPAAQGAFHAILEKNSILQVTPLAPLALGAKGLAVDVVVGGVKQEVFLLPAVGD